jgi:hypothetical protein
LFAVSDLGQAAGNIIQILANLPDFLRKPMLQKRLKEFFGMSDADRQETIALALAAAPTIEPAKLSVLVRTWLEVLAGFDSEERTVIFNTYCRQILKQPESLQKLNFQSLTDTFKEVLLGLPRGRSEILGLVPEDTRRALGLV